METLCPNEPFRFSAQAPSGSAAANASSEDLVHQTRREIQLLVREASDLVHSCRDAKAFWPAFLDRVQRATAANSVSLWQLNDDLPTELQRVGRPAVPESDTFSVRCHAHLVGEVAFRAEPVLVPPTSEATEPDEAANTTDSLAVLVPILVDGKSEAILEVLMPTGGGLATQRGYLRFAAQMGDLAGEFLRTETLRQVRQDQQDWIRWGHNVAGLHRSLAFDDTAAAIVDVAAATFEIDRVSLLQRDGNHWNVVAISGVPDFDSHAPTVKALSGYVQHRRQIDEGAIWPVESIDEASDIIPVVGLLPLGPSSSLLLQSTGGPLSPAERKRWLAFADHATSAWNNTDRFESIPYASLQSQLFTAGGRVEGSRRTLIVAVLIAMLLSAVAMIPVPLIVSAEGKLEPVDKQIVYAPRDAMVSKVLVAHGDHVQRGDILAELIDPQLDQQIDDCLGQQNVLEQRDRELKALMISMAGKSSEERERIEGEFKVVQQKRDGIARQIRLLQTQRTGLTLRAAQAGQVIGWRIQQELADRPVRRSQQLLQVVDPDGRWVVRASVPQERIDHVLQAVDGSDKPVDAQVVFRSFPNQPINGNLQNVGLAALTAESEPATGMAEVAIETADLPIRQPGAIATVAIPCGQEALVYVAFQDLIRAVSEAIGVYL
ncbi:HlyD family efflux transporter periplasmic adaptor subunit [Rosistilla oblonga]|uniref:HlyD family efflux transporter periplasmic adaptor subunit n=1 Tax=Rosistilla oblonga TaxID=2527990 RepID=UPI003A97F43F